MLPPLLAAGISDQGFAYRQLGLAHGLFRGYLNTLAGEGGKLVTTPLGAQQPSTDLSTRLLWTQIDDSSRDQLKFHISVHKNVVKALFI